MTGRQFLSVLAVAASGSLLSSFSAAQDQIPDAGSALRELRELREPPPVPDRPSATIEVPIEPEPAIREAPGLELELKAFRIRGLSVLSEQEVLPLLDAFLGSERGFADLEAAARVVTDRLRDDGYFLAQAYLPAQKVTDGVVEIAVLEGRIGRVRVEGQGDVPVSAHIVEGLLSALQPGTLIRDDTIERALFLVGDLRGLRVESLLQPGETPGTADLLVTLSPTQRFEALVEVDNLGSRFTGQERVVGTIDWNSPFERGDLLSLRALQTSGDRLSFGRVSYLTPLGPFGTKIGAAYSKLDYDLGTSVFKPLNAGGEATVKSLFVLHPLVRERNLNLFATIGREHRKLRDDFDALDLSNPRTVDVSVLTLVGDSRDRWLSGGINTFSASYTSGSVELRSQLQRIIDTSAIGRQIEGHFSKMNLSFSRLQQFDPNGRYFGFLSFNGQWASQNLDSSEKVSLGGPFAVRAYAEGEAASDSALLLTAEFRKPLGLPALLEIPGYAIGSLFFDIAHGHISKRPLLTDRKTSRTLAGIGVGFRWGLPDDFLLNATAAWRLTDRPTGDPQDRTPRIYFSLSKSF